MMSGVGEAETRRQSRNLADGVGHLLLAVALAAAAGLYLQASFMFWAIGPAGAGALVLRGALLVVWSLVGVGAGAALVAGAGVAVVAGAAGAVDC